VEKARTLWDEMIQEGVQPDITAYNTMISGYCQSGEVGVAEDMFKNMLMGAIDSSATTFEWLVRGHCMARDVEAAMLVHADMKRKGFGLATEVVEELLDGLCKNGRVEDGFSVLREEMKREEFVPTRRSYKVLIMGFCDGWKVEVAIRLQAEMAGKGFTAGSEVYYAFISAYEKSENYEMVEKLRKEMAAIGT
jgi:pentatricopeptide repeat protein